MEIFPMLKLPNEILVQTFGLLDFESFISMKSSCRRAKYIADKNLRLMPKKSVESLIVDYDRPSAHYRNSEQPIATVTINFDNGNEKEFSISSEDNLMFFLYNLKVTKKLIILAYNHSFTRHFSYGPQVENVKILELYNISISTPISKAIPLFERLKKCNQLRLEKRCFLNGKFSRLLNEMDYCYSLWLVTSPKPNSFNNGCLIPFDNECLKVISSKSTPSNPTLTIYAPTSPEVISLPALIEFLHNTHFTSNASITLSRVIATRHQLITQLHLSTQLEISLQSHYDFTALYESPHGEGNNVRLYICHLQSSTNHG